MYYITSVTTNNIKICNYKIFIIELYSKVQLTQSYNLFKIDQF